MEYKTIHTLDELRFLQSLPLDVKVLKAKERIREFVQYFGVDGCYLAASQGKDSDVTVHIARQLYPDLEAVFLDSGVDLPEMRQRAKLMYNTTIIYPKMTFKEVIIKYGYPFISKEVSDSVYRARRGNPSMLKKFDIDSEYVKKYGAKYDLSRYAPLLTTDFRISSLCCNYLKKLPFNEYVKTTFKKPILGTLAEESLLRENMWLRYGCNSFEGGKQSCKPLSIFTEQDVLHYIKANNMNIAEQYGKIICDEKDICRCEKAQRSGCFACGYGAHLDTLNGGTSRYILLRQSHPKLYDYCMRGGEHNDRGIWIPSANGLGMKYVIDSLNKIFSKTLKNGRVKPFIVYE